LKKKGHTTFRTFRGGVIQISPGITAHDLDIHSAFTWEKFLREGIDAHFNARTVSLVREETSLDYPSRYWIQESYKPPLNGYIKCPSDLLRVAICSKRAFNYPRLSFEMVLPTLAGYPAGSVVWVGLENGASVGNGIAAFRWRTPDGVSEVFEAVAAGGYVFGKVTDITNLLPANAKTARNIYQIVVMRNLVEFYIARNPVAFAVIMPSPYPPETFSIISGPPYAIFPTAQPVSTSMTTLLEVDGEGEELTFQLPPFYFRVSDGDPLQPRVFRLYQAGSSTMMAGSTINAGSLTSHPIPIFGFQQKTFFFQASQAGTLDIEVLTQTDNWRTYDTINVAANTLTSYIMQGNAVLARVTFTPSSYPCTINDAEVVVA